MKADDLGIMFHFFNEIGIIQQLSSTRLEAALPKGLIVPHFSVLNHLIRVGDGRTPLQIARAFEVPKTSMTNTLATLARHGFVDMRSNPKDARSKQVWITDAGRSLRDATIQKIAPEFAKIFADFPRAKVEALIPELAEIRELLDAARD